MRNFYAGAVFAASLFSAAISHAATLSSTTHPDAVVRTFDDAIGFSAYAVPGGVPSGAQLSLVKSGDGQALQMRNAYAGSFSVDWKIAPFDANKLGDLYFDYKLQPDVKINIFFRFNGVYHCAVFSGPPRSRPGGVLIGKIADVKAEGLNGQWRRAHIPLRDWLRTLYPTLDAFLIDEVVCGNWDNTGYLVAGFGGNGAGATWQIDNLALVGNGPGEAKIAVSGAPAGATWTLDDGVNAPRPAKPTPLAGNISVPARDGFAWVFARDKTGAALGAWAVQQAASAPSVSAVAVAVENNEIRVKINAPGGLGLSKLALEIDGRKFERNSPELRWNGADKSLVLDAARAGFSFANGQKVEVKVTGISDMSGRTAADAALTTTVDWKNAAPRVTNVPRLKIEGAEELQNGSFEHDSGGWTTNEPRGAIVERDATVAGSGRTSLRLTAAGNATPFRAWVRRAPFDASKYPVISFWYRVPANMRADFLLNINKITYSVTFTDRDNPAKKLGKIEGVVADNTWRFASFDLAAMMKKVEPALPNMQVDSLAIGDIGWLGNARGTQYFIDDFRYVPATPSPLKATLQLDDVTGIKAVAWTVDDNPQTDLLPQPSAGGNAIEVSGSGLRFVHARVQNGAGTWSETVHIPVFLQ
jgi:hypothetical protein